MNTAPRRALLLAALAAMRVKTDAPELAILHAWLDSWSGLGLVVVGMQRHGYDLTLTHDRSGWRATFLHRSHVLYDRLGHLRHIELRGRSYRTRQAPLDLTPDPGPPSPAPAKISGMGAEMSRCAGGNWTAR